MSHRFARTTLLVLVALIGLSPYVAQGHDASPVATPAETATGASTVVASGLTNPRGFTWDADGTLYVGSAGTGGDAPATEEWPTKDAVGPWYGGPTAGLVRIEDGCPVTLVSGLPSSIDSTGGVLGAEDVAFLDDQLYVAVDGGGAAHGNPDDPSGVYRVLDDGTTELVADLSAWVRANPVATPPGDLDPDAAGYAMVADEGAGVLWVTDPNSGQILTVTPDGTVARVADLSAGHPVPTRMALAPEGGVYVGTLTTIPYADGAAKVLHVAADGTVTEVWTGLTAVVAVAVGPDGALYALELSTGNLDEPPFLVPGSGRVVRQTGPDSLEEIATGLTLPIAMRFGPEGSLYVALPAIGADTGDGVILRLKSGDGTPVAAETSGACPASSASPAAG